MEDSYSIQISGNLVQQLVTEGEKFKKKTRKTRTKAPRSPRQSETKSTQKEIPDDSQTHKTGPLATGWPLQPPLFLPAPPPPVSANAELEAIRSTLHESEKVVERLQKQEEEMASEVTQRAKELHDKEFKLPYQKPMPCLADYNSCLDCYKEHAKDPLKCADLVKNFADCARSARQQVSSADA